MAIERFSAGEPVSARKLNNLVCALNNLCTSARNLQRGQTLSLGGNDRPRRFWGGTVSCGETCFTACVDYRAVPLYLPPFAVLKIGDRLYVKCGVWKTSNKDFVRAGGWFGYATTARYVYATRNGKIVLSSVSCDYDWRFYQLLADLHSWCAENERMRICGCMTCVSFPAQYWVGDICRPTPSWSQGGVFASCVRQCGKIHICGGFAYIESPLAVAGKRSLCMADQTVHTQSCMLTVVSGYYPVPATELNIPVLGTGSQVALMLHYKHTTRKGFSGSAGEFTWYWADAEASHAVPVVNCDTASFSYSVSTTSELEIGCGACRTYVKCMVGSGTPTNYTYDGGGNWGLAVPMGRAFYRYDGIICARVSQKIPEFRARPIINLWGAKLCMPMLPDKICSSAGSEHFTIRTTELSTRAGGAITQIAVPYKINVAWCDCKEPASTVYKAPKQNTISETYYTNGNA